MFERVCNNNHYHLPIEGSSPLIGNRAAAAGSYNTDMCREWAQIMNTFMLTEYWPPTEEAYPAEYDTEQPAEQHLALQPQQAMAEQQPQVYDNDEQLDNNRGILTRLQETQ